MVGASHLRRCQASRRFTRATPAAQASSSPCARNSRASAPRPNAASYPLERGQAPRRMYMYTRHELFTRRSLRITRTLLMHVGSRLHMHTAGECCNCMAVLGGTCDCLVDSVRLLIHFLCLRCSAADRHVGLKAYVGLKHRPCALPLELPILWNSGKPDRTDPTL